MKRKVVRGPEAGARFAQRLREALGAMQMALEVLRRPGDEPTRTRMIELIDRQVTVLGKLADECCAPADAGSGDEPASSVRRILVVDDNVDSAEVLGALLEQMGHEVFVAYTGARAMEVAHERRPDIVFLDLALPDVSGFEVARGLRQDASLDGMRIIGLTGFGSDEHRRHGADAGLDDYVVKPVNADHLARLIAAR